MALLVLDLGPRPQAVRVDLAVLTGDRGVAAVADVPPGAHRVSALLEDGWRHGWVYVGDPDEVVSLGGDGPDVVTDAVVALPPDGGGWAALTAHLDSREAVFHEAGAESGSTRFERVLAAHGGHLLAALERSFLDWTLPPDGLDEDAGARWLALVVAVAAAGTPGVDAQPALLADAASVIATQLSALPPGALEASLRDALEDLAVDLADAGLDEPAATLRSAVGR